MDAIAEKLVDQVLSERELYEDNARIRHGIPRRPRRSQQTSSKQSETLESTVVHAAKPVAKSLVTTAAMLALSAAGGGLAAPLVPAAINMIWPTESKEQSQPQSTPQQTVQPPDPKDLIEWIRQNRLNANG